MRRIGLNCVAAIVFLCASNPSQGQNVTEFALPQQNSFPRAIVAGSDGNLWFTETTANRIGRITPEGVITEFDVPTVGSAPQGITVGGDGAVWFAESSGNKIGRAIVSGAINEFPIPTSGAMPQGITLGPDGAIWFTEAGANKIGKLESGSFTEFALPTANSLPQEIVAGPDRNLWFTLYNANKIGRITPDGVITEFAIPTAGSLPLAITVGPDNALWFTELVGNKIGRITIDGVITEFSVPTPLSGPFDIAVGRDGNLWFVQTAVGKIGRLTSTGSFSEFPIPTPASQPVGIVTGPDGGLWFTENSARKIGRIMPERLGLHIGPVFSSAQANMQSFLRFYNGGTTTADVSVVLSDYTTALPVGQWGSSIPAGAALQFGIAEIEQAIASSAPFTKPQFYSATIRSASSGLTFQHVLWQNTVGTLTNLSTCGSGVAANRQQLNNVHTGQLQNSYPSSVVVANTGLSNEAVTLGLFDARTGVRLGTYTSAQIAANARAIIPVTTIESALSLTPAANAFHYIVRAEGRFSGFLEHLVTNRQTGVITDMTSYCTIPAGS